MSPLVAMWVASIAGALLFFVAGYFAAPRRAAEGAGADAGESAEPKAKAPEPAESKAKAEPKGVDPKVHADKVPELERTIAELTTERDTLANQTTELERQLQSQLAAIRQHDKRVAELEQELATQTDAAKAHEKRVAELEEELSKHTTDEEATMVASEGKRGEGARSRAPGLDSAVHDMDVLASLSHLLERRVERDDSCKAVVLADDLGMPIVGAGDKREALAVFSGLIELMEMRTRALLPISDLRRLTVEDAEGTTVSTCTLSDRSLSLVMLTDSKFPSTQAMSDLLQSMSGML